jgi:hypothetical protein
LLWYCKFGFIIVEVLYTALAKQIIVKIDTDIIMRRIANAFLYPYTDIDDVIIVNITII